MSEVAECSYFSWNDSVVVVNAERKRERRGSGWEKEEGDIAQGHLSSAKGALVPL